MGGKARAKMQLSRNEYWRLKYRNNRYMQYIDLDSLYKRRDQVFGNIIGLNEDGKLYPVIVKNRDLMEYWSELSAQVLEELELRGLNPLGKPTFGNKIRTDDDNSVDLDFVCDPKVAKELKKYENGKVLIKYSKAEFLKEMLEKGRFRIAPASLYMDSSLNSAQKDDELRLELELHPLRPDINAFLKKHIPKTSIHPVGNIRYTLKSKTNYYVFCLSSSSDIRLFGDFKADGCLVIKHPEDFIRAIIDAFKKQNKGWRGFGTPVYYIDPLNPSDLNIDIFFTKHFRYWYQQEYRVIWLSSDLVNELEPVYIEIGPLHDYCELILL